MGRREENTDLLVTGGRSVVGGHRWEAVLIHVPVVVVTAAAGGEARCATPETSAWWEWDAASALSAVAEKAPAAERKNKAEEAA